MRILITNHTAHQAHLGCQATCEALEQLLRERFGPAEIAHENHNIKRADYLMYGGEAGRRGRAAQMQSGAAFAAFREADIIVVNGEGTFHSKTWLKWGASSNQRLVEAYLAKRDLHKRVMIVNHSISSHHAPFDRLVKATYSQLDYAAVREPYSLQYLRGLGLGHVQQAADSIFSLTPPAPSTDSPLRGKVLISDSFGWKFGWQQRRPHVASLLDQLRAQGLEVAFISVLTNARDAHFAQSLGLEYHAFTSAQQFMAHLQSAHFVLSGRFHIAIFAALCGVPFLGFEANTYKLQGLCKLLEHPCPPIEFARHAPDAVLQAVNSALLRRDELAQLFVARRSFMRDLARQNVPPRAEDGA